MNDENLIETIKENLVLEKDPAYLRDIPHGALAELSRDIQDYRRRIEEEQRPVYQVIAAATKIIPNFVLVRMALDFLSPYIIARVTPYLSPSEAASIGRGFPPEFLGRVALYVEPGEIAAISEKMGTSMVTKVFQEMIRLEFFHRMGEVADHLSDDLIRALLNGHDNPAHIAKIAHFMTDEDKIRAAAASLTGERAEAVRNALQDLGDDAKAGLIKA